MANLKGAKEMERVCKTCKHWIFVNAFSDGLWGRCTLATWTETSSDFSRGDHGLVARRTNQAGTRTADGPAHLGTRDTFGCNQWQGEVPKKDCASCKHWRPCLGSGQWGDCCYKDDKTVRQSMKTFSCSAWEVKERQWSNCGNCCAMWQPKREQTQVEKELFIIGAQLADIIALLRALVKAHD